MCNIELERTKIMSNQFNLGMFQSSPSEFKNADVTSASSCPVSKIATEFEPFWKQLYKKSL